MTEEDRKLTKIYDLARKIRDMAPWKWMTETDVFGVEPSESSRTWFVSVMGEAGTHCAITAYEGTEALYGFHEFYNDDCQPRPFDILLLPQLMLSFENREALEHQEWKRLKNLGFSFRGRGAWPLLRRIEPGHPPVFPDASELDDFIAVLEQTMLVSRRIRSEKLPLLAPGEQDAQGLIRKGSLRQAASDWTDELRAVEPEMESFDVMLPPPELLEQLQQIPQQQQRVLEVDLALLPSPVKEQGRPFYPFTFLIMDAQSGIIEHFEMLHPEPSYREMHGRVTEPMLRFMLDRQIRPREIAVRSAWLYSAFKMAFSESGVQVNWYWELPAADDAYQGLLEHLGSG